MKSYEELTHLGRLRRMRLLAAAALEQYGLGGPYVKLSLQAGNGLYRVNDLNPEIFRGNGDLFEPGQYLLRVYHPGWQTPEAIELELTWLAAMRNEAGLTGARTNSPARWWNANPNFYFWHSPDALLYIAALGQRAIALKTMAELTITGRKGD